MRLEIAFTHKTISCATEYAGYARMESTMGKAVKLADIAKQMNVSTVTVSKALSGQKGVSEEMREKIKKLADELGYRQPSAARLAAKNKSYNIGVIIAEHYLGKYNTFYWQLYQEVTTKAAQKECFTMLEVLTLRMERELEIPKILKEDKVDGLVIIGKVSSEYLRELESETKIPLMLLDFYSESEECDAVVTDNFYGAYLLTNYLFKMGHKRIAYVGTLMYTGSITDRYFGYAKSLMEHGVEVRQDWVIADRDMETGLIGEGGTMQLPEEMPTAFVCNSDLTASELIKLLGEHGYCVPEDISVVGFDNYLYPGLCDVEITSYEVDMREMARKTINTLIKKMANESYKKGLSVVEGHMVYKDSVQRFQEDM